MTQDTELQKKDYELSFLLKAPEAETEIADVLSRHQLEVFEKSPISEIKLAYPIKKQNSAYFGFCYFRGQPENAPKVSESLLLKSSVLRYLLITPPVKSKTDIRSKGRFLGSGVGSPAVKLPKEMSGPKGPATAEADIKPPRQEILSNELLEEKLEEILK